MISSGRKPQACFKLRWPFELRCTKALGKGCMVDRGVAEAVIVGAVRTPLGKRGGALSSVRPDDLAALALDALMERTGVPFG